MAATSSPSQSASAPKAAFAVRHASHAGSWYSDSKRELSSQLDGWLDSAAQQRQRAKGDEEAGNAVAVIAPHAGYSYSGPAAAFAYGELEREAASGRIRRVFVLGPSHHRATRLCELSGAESYETPLGSLRVDREAYGRLRAGPCKFGEMPREADEDEHSIEMHMPYIHRAMARGGAKEGSYAVVPVLVGALSRAKEREYGRGAFAPLLDDPENFFVVSSDFCHWGARFRYTYRDPSVDGEIWQSIEALDRRGMDAIETQDPARFAEYQDEYENTVCGRHPIAVLMHAIDASGKRHSTRFLHYSQSSRVRTMRDSSVSYASAVVRQA